MRIPAALATASVTLLLAPAAASAATAEGTVVGEPAARGTKLVVPVALTVPSAKALRLAGTQAKLTVVAVRGRTGALRGPDLRLGDVVRLSGARRSGATRARGRTLRVRSRGDAPSFRQLAASLDRARDATRAALAEVERITSPGITAVGGPGDAALRAALLDVRGGVNDRIADLRDQGRALDALAGRLGPAQAATPRLRAAGDTASSTADRLDAAVGTLDERINDIGGAPAHPIPLESTSAVSEVLYGILDLLRALP